MVLYVVVAKSADESVCSQVEKRFIAGVYKNYIDKEACAFWSIFSN